MKQMENYNIMNYIRTHIGNILSNIVGENTTTVNT
jgi:hypothetical protein